ncbi:MAG TPA: CCE_0567 family metalloprotein [Patescibacteria group bacterium]|nr:CCE_0567 family metalloprotein [Patescibacteria group bacterium]
MSEDRETLRAEIKKLSGAAITLKMDLHDLSEELPIGWQRVMDVAGRTQEAYRKLHEARERLKALEG